MTISAAIAQSRSTRTPASLLGPALRWLLFALGAVYFIWAAHAAAYSPSMDYAVVVEMARNMASGKDFPVFYYGQAYMGSLEPAISALFCRMFGPSPFSVCLGTAILGIATLFVTMLVGKRMSGEFGGILSLALAITGGYYWIHFMVSPRGGYALATLLVVSSISMASIANFHDAGTGKVRISLSALLGLMAGLAFWNFWIALPAFAAAGAIILARLRLRAFSARFILPCLAAFFIGSMPWWVWNAQNGFAALDTKGNGPPPIGWLAIRNLFSSVIPSFYGTSPSAPDFWHSLLPLTLAVILLLSIVSILAGHGRALKTFLCATIIYTGLFAVAYAKSSFGSMGVARYLVPFVPVFSILCGSALGRVPQAWTSPQGGRRRYKAIWIVVVLIALGFYALEGAKPSVGTSISNLKGLKEKGRQLKDTAEVVANDSSLAQAAFADYSLFGYNWASNRRVCFVSPLRWRYAPYMDKLEEAVNPAVINNYHSFRAFCQASGGTWRDRSLTRRLHVIDHITPPPETEVASFPASPIVKTEAGADVANALFDDNFATGVLLQPTLSSYPHLDVFFNSTSIVTGVSILMDSYRSAVGWKVDFIDSDGAITPGISEIPHNGWYWSGPRQYQFGPEERWTIRWGKRRVAVGIRISFKGNKLGGPILISDMRFISDKPLPTVDIDAIKDAIATARQQYPDLRIHAGRWLGRQIGAPPDPATRFGHSSGNLGLPEVCDYVTMDHAHTSLLVFRDPCVAEAAGKTLQSLGLDFEKTETAGCVLISVPRCEPLKAGTVPLRLVGGRLMRDDPREMDTSRYEPIDIDFGGVVSLAKLAPIPNAIHPGETFYVDMLWQFHQKPFVKGDMFFIIHAIQNNKIVFQSITRVDPLNIRSPADRPNPFQMNMPLAVPKDIAAGEVTFAACIKRDAHFARRLKPSGKDISTIGRRAILGRVTIVRE